MIREDAEVDKVGIDNAPLQTAENGAAEGIDGAGGGLAAAGGLVGAVAASACCIVPLIFFSLGVGGAWVGRLASLSPYQPFFLAFAALSIGYGFWQVYRRPACADGTACARPLPRRLVKAALWSATVLTVIAAVYPFVIPYIL